MIVGGLLLVLGAYAIAIGLTAKEFYGKFPGSATLLKKEPKLVRRLMYIGVGSIFAWKGLMLLLPRISQ